MENQEHKNTPTSKQETNRKKLYGLYDENLSSEKIICYNKKAQWGSTIGNVLL